MLHSVTSSFIARLRANDQEAWFELWETFGPVLRAQLTRWGRGRIGPETVRDLSQETLAALSDSIDRYDPARGARFSTWLLAIAKHVLGAELDKRSAQKRGGDKARAAGLDESWMGQDPGPGPDAAYEAAVLRAKVEAALRLVEKESEATDFAVFRLRVLEGRAGKEVADALGVSEPTVSRRLARVRTALRGHLEKVIAAYSFTSDELAEAEVAGLGTARAGGTGAAGGGGGVFTAAEDAALDEAVGEIYRRGREDAESGR
jgi:RNA polymerase sigma factor (sigma-70 family)